MRRREYLPICYLVVLSLLSTDLSAQVLPLDPQVRTGKLPNGFTYFIRHNEEPKNRVVMYMINKVGSILEDDDQQGLAHFMEHMSFNGTTHFPKNELVNYLQKAGVKFGADINAYTSFDETVYQLPLPTTASVLHNGLQIMRDWAKNATLDPVEIDKERGVVLEEKRLGKVAAERMRRHYWPLILNGSRYSTRMPIGTDSVLNHFKPETIKRFYQDWYRPDLQALIIVGDINVDSLEKMVKVQFANLKNPNNERERMAIGIPLLGKNQFIAVTDKEMTATVAEVMIKHPAPKLKTEQDYRWSIVRGLYDQMISARYGELTRQQDPPFLSASAGVSGFMGGLDSYTISVTAKPGELEKGFKAIWRETERVKRFGFTQTELDRAKQSYLSNLERAYAERNKTRSENYVKEYQAYFLKGEASPGIEIEYALGKKYLADISLADMNHLSKEYIGPVNRDILLMAPEKDKGSLPSEAIVNQWLADITAEKLEPYHDAVSALPLLAHLPLPGKTVAETTDQALNMTTLTLSNGLKVVLKPTDFKNDQIIFNGFAPGGTSLYSDADYFSAASAAGAVASGGADNYNLTELSKYLSGKQLSVSPLIAERSQGFNGGSTPKDLESTLQLLYAYWTAPRKDKAVFDGSIARSKAGLANRANDPNSVFSDTVSAVLGSYNIRRTGPSIKRLDQINLDRAFDIYKERFSDAANFTFTFVGSFNVAEIKPLLEKYLGALPFTQKHEQAKDLGINIPPGKIAKTVYKGTEPKATVDLVFSGSMDYSLENSMKLSALKEVLEIRLLERLREDESGVYSPSASANISKLPQGRYSFVISFGCAPQNVEKLIASALDEVNKLRTDGPPQVNIDKYKAEYQHGLETALKTNTWWLGYLAGQLQNNEDLHQMDHYEKSQESITIASLKEAAKQYLGGENYIRLVLLPASTN